MAYRNYSGAWLPDTNQAGVRYVRGTWADETLYGSGGADEFEGGGGWDAFVGGSGDDFYWLRDGRHSVTEHAGGGIDTVKLWSSHALAPNVENLIVFGGGSHAVGNDLNNVIRGEDGAQYLYGGRGEDVLVGGNGPDTFVVRLGEGHKVIEDFQSWTDSLRLIGGPLTSFDAVKAAMTQQGSDVVLNDGGTMILFRNANVSQFAARDFQLPINPSQLGQLTFSDEFNTLQTGSVWKTNFGYAGDGLASFTLPRNGEQQIYVSPEFKGTTGSPLGLNPYSVNNGVLTITAKPVSDAVSANMWGFDYQSGMLDSHFTQTYGYFEIRAELPLGQGLWPAFWLLGPDNNEIDILEQIGSDPRVPQQAVHSNAGHWGGGNFVPDIGGFHTYGALWTPKDVIFYVDGTEVVRTPTPSDMNKPMHMIVNLAVGGNWPGSPDSSTPWPAQMKVDYVKVWALPGASAPPPVTPPPPPSTGPGVSLASSGFGATMTGTSGSDTLTAGNGAEQMTGGAGADVFVWNRVPWSPTEVRDFQVGVDKLNLSALMGGYSGSDALADRRLVLESDGAGGAKVSVDPDGAGGSWPNYIVHLQGVPTAGLTASTLLTGGAAPVPPPPPTGTTGVSLISPGFGATMIGTAGNDTLTAGNGGEQMTGGAGADAFVWTRVPWNPTEVRDFQVGIDKLDLRALMGGYSGSDAVADRRLVLESDGAGGAKVSVDADGVGGSWPSYVAHLQGVPVSSLNAANLLGTGSSPPTTTGVALTSSGFGATMTGTAGNDTLTAGNGAEQMTGGAGADVFDFDRVPWNPSEIRDFQDGVDKLDLSGLMRGYTGSNPLGDRRIVLESDGAGGTKLSVDPDGAGGAWPNYIAHIQGVAPSSLTGADWIIR